MKLMMVVMVVMVVMVMVVMVMMVMMVVMVAMVMMVVMVMVGCGAGGPNEAPGRLGVLSLHSISTHTRTHKHPMPRAPTCLEECIGT